MARGRSNQFVLDIYVDIFAYMTNPAPSYDTTRMIGDNCPQAQLGKP